MTQDSEAVRVERGSEYPAAERAFHVVIRNKGEPGECFVARDRATLTGVPAKDRGDAHALAASLNKVVAFHAARHRRDGMLAAADTVREHARGWSDEDVLSAFDRLEKAIRSAALGETV